MAVSGGHGSSFPVQPVNRDSAPVAMSVVSVVQTTMAMPCQSRIHEVLTPELTKIVEVI